MMCDPAEKYVVCTKTHKHRFYILLIRGDHYYNNYALLSHSRWVICFCSKQSRSFTPEVKSNIQRQSDRHRGYCDNELKLIRFGPHVRP